MGDSSTTLHEPREHLRPATIDRHRAIVSLMEELEAVDWYSQRVDATHDASLASVLAHNRDEEQEHAAMTLEWLRRHDPGWDRMLRRYLFTEGPIARLEAEAETEAVTEDAGETIAGAGVSEPNERGADLGIRGAWS